MASDTVSATADSTRVGQQLTTSTGEIMAGYTLLQKWRYACNANTKTQRSLSASAQHLGGPLGYNDGPTEIEIKVDATSRRL